MWPGFLRSRTCCGAGGSSDVGVIGSGGDVNEDTGLGGSGNEDPDNVGVDKDDEYGENITIVGDQNGNQLPQSPSVGEDVQKYLYLCMLPMEVTRVDQESIRWELWLHVALSQI